MNRSKDHMVLREARMQFKTAQQIREEREAAGKDKEREARQREKLAEKARRKYDRMAEEAAKREAAAKAKPKLVVNRENVIVAPALLAERQPAKQSNFGTAQVEDAMAKRNIEEKKARQAEKIRNFGKTYDAGSMPKPEAKQVWDEATKSWVKRG